MKAQCDDQAQRVAVKSQRVPHAPIDDELGATVQMVDVIDRFGGLSGQFQQGKVGGAHKSPDVIELRF